MRTSAISCIVIIALSLVSMPAEAQQPTKFNAWSHVIGRHPVLRDNDAFRKWIAEHNGDIWYEDKQENGPLKVVMYDSAEKSVFAALIELRDQNEALVKVATSELDAGYDKAYAMKSFQDVPADAARIISVRPTIKFDGDSDSAEWEVLRMTSPKIESYTIPKEGKPLLKSSRTVGSIPKPLNGLLSSNESDGRVPPAADEMASNELHHLSSFASETATAIGNASTVDDKARRIFNYVRNNMTYDGSIFQIDCFTWSDLLTRDTNGRRGICDEWAVMEITMLRQAGIPARMKFLIWNDSSGTAVGHACVEYKDGPVWYHMDALWNAFKNPGIYRSAAGATNLTVMDADYPVDSRSDVDAWTCPDSRGDQKLHPYQDCVIIPNYPGNSRPGYSN